MKTKNDFHDGQRVYFGRENGQRTLGKIVKRNPSRAQVEILEVRGTGRGSAVGSVWTIGYSALEPADPADVVPPAPKQPLVYSPLAGNDNLILEAINNVYANLSPENLSCDGELSHGQVQSRAKALYRQLANLQRFWGPPIGFGITVYGDAGKIVVVVPSKTKKGSQWMRSPISKPERERALKAAQEQVPNHVAK